MSSINAKIALISSSCGSQLVMNPYSTGSLSCQVEFAFIGPQTARLPGNICSTANYLFMIYQKIGNIGFFDFIGKNRNK